MFFLTPDRPTKSHKAPFRRVDVTRPPHDAGKPAPVNTRERFNRHVSAAFVAITLLGASVVARAQATEVVERTDAATTAPTPDAASETQDTSAAPPVEPEQDAAEAPEDEAPSDASAVTPAAALPEPPRAAEPATPPPTAATGDVHVQFEPGNGLHIASNDGRFELVVRARAQFLATLRHPDGGDAGLDFELRRARIYFQGAVFDPAIRFTIQLGVSPSCSDMGNNFAGNGCNGPQSTSSTTLTGFTPRWSPLLDWYLEDRHLREMNVRVGQMIATIHRTFTTGDANYQFIDRALGDGEFNLDRTFAIELRSTDFAGLGWLRYYAGIMSTQGRDMPFAPDMHLGYYLRVDVNPLGFFNDYSGGDLARNVSPRLSIGAAYAFLDHAPWDHGTVGQLPQDGGTTDQHMVTADFVFMWQGFSLVGEWSMRQATRHQGSAVDPATMMPYATPSLGRTGFGMHATAGMLLGDLPLELVARAGMLRHMNALDGGAHSAILDQNEVGAGLNWYIAGHPLKMSLWFTDVWRDDGVGSSGAQVVRLQLQATL